MTVYFGLPVISKEACRVFDLDYDAIVSEHNQINTRALTPWYIEHIIIDYLNKYFERNRMKMRIYCTDNLQCIIGYKISETSDTLNVDQYIYILTELKMRFALETHYYETNFAEMTLEHIDCEPEIVNNPIPRIIEYSAYKYLE